MTGNIVPLNSSTRTDLGYPASRTLPTRWGEAPPAAPPPPPAQKLQRYLSVLGRFKWLILLVTVLGTAVGVVATRFVEPTYVVDAQIWIASEAPITNVGRNAGPAQAAELVAAAAWTELFRSGAVSDDVARQMGLFVTPADDADSALFRNFDVASQMRVGTFDLRIDGAGRGYQLLFNGQQPVETGFVGDSIGRSLGFLWRPAPELLTPGRNVTFTVVNPREAGLALNSRLTTRQEQNFLKVSLEGTDPVRTQEILDYWIVRFVDVARELKKDKLVDYANTQMINLQNAERELRDAELAYQQFKIGAITKPMESTVVAPGMAETQPTVMSTFFEQRLRLDDLRATRRALERVLANTRSSGTISDADLYALTSIPEAAANPALTGSVSQLNQLQSERRASLSVYTDSADFIRSIDDGIRRLQTQTIPGQINSLLAQVRTQERDLAGRIGAAERELQEIPERSTREQQLAREVLIKSNLASNLSTVAQSAQLAAESATPDVSVLDYPVAPLRPSKNTMPQILAAAVLGSLALALVAAFLIDRLDQRFRYPEQAKDDLGLDILGAVPRLRSASTGVADEEEANHVLEAFRTIRLNVRQALDEHGPLVFAVSSPAAGDGKSLVASNLAVSFAEAGHRVLLIDGDIRRGSLHAAFAAPHRDALRPTSHRNLTLMPCGKRLRQAPELLASAALPELLEQLRGTYDVIVLDSPPLSAGIDAYTLGTAAGAMAVVLRSGSTNMRLAHAKLSDLDRYPVFALGAVLNDITPKGVYEYYNYGYGYAMEEDEPGTTIPGEAEEGVLTGAGAPQLGGGDDGREPTARA
ncbi:MAG TPA: Wzz/FepE/Etk N-terminal domain-containing protein [Gemmatimonadaceae bacterium]|nr:Wzz/FepE/Etk N-terminal domain-containing protein [Gemmatimonadaceae bacterium]